MHPKVAPVPGVPLCIDMDGTLIKTNTMFESIAALARIRPAVLLLWPFWLLRGCAAVWRKIGPQTPLDAAGLPYRPEVMDLLRSEAATGRQIVLVTGAHPAVAGRVAEHLGCFDAVIAEDGDRQLVGDRKAELLIRHFGAGGFDYVGDGKKDLPVWRSARKAFAAGASGALLRSISKRREMAIIAPRQPRWRHFLRALRPHQWSKNLLVFVPLILGHKFLDLKLEAMAALAFLAACLAGSAMYLMNDLLDLPSDRENPTKCARPLAAGNLPIEAALAAAPLLVIASGLLAYAAGPMVLSLIALYLVSSTAYSVRLKRIPAVDVVLLAGLYCLRLGLGGAASGITLSPWTVAFSMFLFLSLALMKRYSELHNLKARQKEDVLGRGYRVSDMQAIASLGSASGMTAVLVIALYVNGNDVRTLYHHPTVLWLVSAVVMLWITRMWLIAGRGELHEDPVLFALKDRWSLGIALVTGLILVMAL